MMDGIIRGMKLKERKVYTIEVVYKGRHNSWHNEIAGNGKKYKARWFKGSPHNYFILRNSTQLADGMHRCLINEKYCRVVQDTPTHEIKKVRSVRCL